MKITIFHEINEYSFHIIHSQKINTKYHKTMLKLINV